MKITFFETKLEDQTILQSLLPDLEVSYSPAVLSVDSASQAAGSEIISVFVGSQVNRETIDALPNLKAILTRSTGYDHIDIEHAKQKGITVCNVAGYGSVCVAEFAFGLILAVSRRITEANRRLRQTNEFSFDHLQGFDLHGKTLGVVGTGRIGQNVIRIAQAFGMTIVAFDLHPNPELAKICQYVSLDELLKQADVITIHLPYSKETRHLINAENLKLVKPSAILVNTARGEIVETEALTAALIENRLAGVGLDVLEAESGLKKDKNLVANHPLMKLDQVVVTPHMAFYTQEAVLQIFQTTAQNLKQFMAGKPENLV